MNMFKVSFLSAIETSIKLVAGFIVIKLLAFLYGPETVAKFGQFQNVFTVLTILVSGSFVTGLVKYISESHSIANTLNANKKVASYIQGSITFSIIASAILFLLLIIFSDNISFYVFSSHNFKSIFIFLAFAIFFIAIYQMIIAYLNGLRRIKEMVCLKIFSSIILIVVGIILVYLYGLIGGLYTIILAPTFAGLFGIWYMLKKSLISLRFFKLRIEKKIQSDLIIYWGMNIITLISGPLVLFYIRKYIVNLEGWEAAGLWESIWKLSDLSCLLITTALAAYFIPMLGRTKKKSEQIDLLKKVFLLALGVSVIISVLMFLLKDFLILTLFSYKFLKISGVLKYQLIAGPLRMITWIISLHMLIKAKPIIFISTELFFGLTLYIFSIVFFSHYGLAGLGYAFLLNNIFSSIMTSMYLINFLRTYHDQ